MKDRVKTTACRFSLYPMTDNFIEIILGSLGKTSTEAVFAETDAVSTVYAGSIEAVSDAVRALFINAYRSEIHMAIEGEFTQEIPSGFSFSESSAAKTQSPNRQITEGFHFQVRGRYALYLENSEGANSSGELHGDVQSIFDFLTRVLESAAEAAGGGKYLLRFTVNCNSPTSE